MEEFLFPNSPPSKAKSASSSPAPPPPSSPSSSSSSPSSLRHRAPPVFAPPPPDEAVPTKLRHRTFWEVIAGVAPLMFFPPSQKDRVKKKEEAVPTVTAVERNPREGKPLYRRSPGPSSSLPITIPVRSLRSLTSVTLTLSTRATIPLLLTFPPPTSLSPHVLFHSIPDFTITVSTLSDPSPSLLLPLLLHLPPPLLTLLLSTSTHLSLSPAVTALLCFCAFLLSLLLRSAVYRRYPSPYDLTSGTVKIEVERAWKRREG